MEYYLHALEHYVWDMLFNLLWNTSMYSFAESCTLIGYITVRKTRIRCYFWVHAKKINNHPWAEPNTFMKSQYIYQTRTTYTFLCSFLSSLLKCELFSVSSLFEAEHALSLSLSSQESDEFSFSHFSWDSWSNTGCWNQRSVYFK